MDRITAPTPGDSTGDAAAPAHLRRLGSPIGRIEVIGNGGAIVSLSIERDGRLPCDELPEQSDPVLDRAVSQLEEYFAGHRRDFDLPLSLTGTAFQLSVWEQLVELEFGEAVSYGELGLATGRPAAGRAVGGAVGANPIPIIVPCHRVLGSDGRITGYSGGEGIPTKSWLLRHEGIAHIASGAKAGGVKAGGADFGGRRIRGADFGGMDFDDMDFDDDTESRLDLDMDMDMDLDLDPAPLDRPA